MILSGMIGAFTVPDVFQFLARTRVTGQLVIETDQDQAWIYFNRGDLVYARREGPTERLGERLLRLGYITESQLLGVDLRYDLSPQDKRIGQIFLEAGTLAEGTLGKVVRGQIRETAERILGFEEGVFRFHEGRTPEGEDILLDVDLELLLMEGMKRLDELSRDARSFDGNPFDDQA